MMRQESRMRFLEVSLEDERKRDDPTSLRTIFRRRIMWSRNNAATVAFSFLFVGANMGLFLSRAYQYSHTNLLEMGARACGQCLNLDCALLLLLILRRSVTRLRNSCLGRLFPCDQHVHFHKMAGWTVFFFSILHTLFHLANFVTLSDTTGISVWNYMWDTSLGIGWVGGLANPTGVALLVLLFIIVAFSHRIVRKSGYFEIFYWTHLLSLPFWVLTVLHGPNFWKWLLLPGTAFLMETCLRVAQVCSPRGQTAIISGNTLPSKVVRLTIRRPKDFEFQPGEYVYLRVPAIARYEWHPFTISSAPEQEDVFTVHIRSVGEWTRRLYDMFHTEPPAPVSQEENEAWIEDKVKSSSEGIPNPAFIPSQEEEQKQDTVIEVEEKESDGRGGRYINNLLEFNRKMSVFGRPAMLSVEATERKPAMGGCEEARCPSSTADANYRLERKKSSSLSSLSTLKAELAWPLQGLQFGSKHSSLGGSNSSLSSLRESQQSGANTITSSPSQKVQITPAKNKRAVEVYVDGPYGTPSTRIFSVSHAVLIGAGIGVTPFASILQSVMMRYRAAKAPCPHCHVHSCVALPATLRKLRKVDFMWVNRDLGSFEWFLEVLAALEEEQRVVGAAMEAFLSLHLYKTGPAPLSPNLPLSSSIRHGRPDWDKVFQGIRESRIGKVCVFYCGPPALVGVLREKCIQYKFEFKREMF
ncbi:NADPH oxidase 5-like isoform X1 [Penaeus chinensis]|uniref:NADPH oxidase 5-like isoform X1 n=1 Tax=Penaeus chinensis TaxID=139456 RepID=UPI001FB6DAA6|nr:NADPH oxidase 5-like isoform X1 [Penaeus chinensis]XP_047478869.1 NADPH oxidase 5-like isoform X1 [Penaeus chinensis]